MCAEPLFNKPFHFHHRSADCHENKWKCKHKSIFIRLVFILIGMTLLVHLLVSGFFGILMSSESKQPIAENLAQYGYLIAKDIGSPPDTLKARRYAEKLLVGIRYQNAGYDWATSHDVPPVDQVQANNEMRGHQKLMSRWQQNYLFTNEDGSRLLIHWQIKPVRDMRSQLLLGLLAILTFIFLLTHILIRKSLLPVRWIQRGVDQLGEGNLNVKVPIRGHDELAQLSDAFNNMVTRIREMIQSRDQLLLDVSHELRSPITRMRIALEFLPDSEKKKSILSDLMHIETMITEILETERLKDGKHRLKLARVNLTAFIHEMLPEFQSQKSVQVNLPRDLGVMIDRERIRIVFRNCFDNAVKYSKDSSKPIIVSAKEADAWVHIIIRDFGTGIPEEALPFIFEPFYRADRSRSQQKGYGLGLSICQKIMEAHDGKITIQNHEQGGVEADLIFPKVHDV